MTKTTMKKAAAEAEATTAKAAAAEKAAAENAAPGTKAGPESGAALRRPFAVTIVALMTAAVGALLLVYGVYLMAAGFAGKPVLLGRAELAGGIFVLFGLSLLWVARGLSKLQPWARTPAFITQLAFFGVCYWMVQGHDYVWAVASAALGLLGSVLLFLPVSNEVLNREVRF